MEGELITDGFGNFWSGNCQTCGAPMQIIRPGDARCAAECYLRGMGDDDLEFPELVPGKRYHISVDDCCVVLEADATFLAHGIDVGDSMLYFDTMVFDRAYDHAVTFTLLEDECEDGSDKS